MENKNFTDILEVEGVNARGFGTIPKMVMQDNRLSIEAKAIYSYFCSFAGAGATAFPSLKLILKQLKISKDRYYRHFNLLKKCGYIKTKQIIEKSKFKNNLYTLVAIPVSETVENSEVEPIPQNKESEKKPFPYFEDTQNEDTQNKEPNINSSLKSSCINNYQSVSYDNKKDRQTDEQQNYNYHQKILDTKFKDLQLKTVYNDTTDVNAVKDALKFIYEVNKNIGNYEHDKKKRQANFKYITIDIVKIGVYKFQQADNVKNAVAYLATCIYNALAEKNSDDLYIKNQMNKLNLT